VNPFRGLVIDETTWGEAHDYHRDHQRLHALAFHSPGIAAGLDVKPGDQPGTVIVSPGVGLDHEGNVIVVGQARRAPLEGATAGLVYVSLAYQETRVNADANAPRGAPANRIVESYKVEVSATAPDEPAIELARVLWSGPPNPVRAAADVSNPREDEIDLRFRAVARIARPVTVAVGVVSADTDPVHLRGIANLIREIDNVAGHQATFRGVVAVEEGDAGCDLLYVRRPLDAEGAAATTIASFLGRGGAVLADSCVMESDPAFQGSMKTLAAKVGMRLAPVDPASPLLHSRYPFAEPPAGAMDGDVTAAGRFVLSMRDYGCAWSGSCGKNVLPRETIRASLEWGVNIAIAAVQAAAPA